MKKVIFFSFLVVGLIAFDFLNFKCSKWYFDTPEYKDHETYVCSIDLRVAPITPRDKSKDVK